MGQLTFWFSCWDELIFLSSRENKQGETEDCENLHSLSSE